MPGPKDLDPSASPRALLGSELRHAREAAGLTQAQLGEPLFVSGSFIGQLEAGIRRMYMEYAVQLDEILDTNGFFKRNCEAAAKSKYPDHFAEAAEAEARAIEIREYAPLLIPGLLQTRDYAWAVCRAYEPTSSDETIERLVEARLERARLLQNPMEPTLWAVFDEAVLRRKVGGAAVMGEALRHVAGVVRRRRAIVQIMPFESGGHAAMGGAIKLMHFTDSPTMAYLEGPGTGRLEDDPVTVRRHIRSYDLLGVNALSPHESLALIESVAEEYALEVQKE